MSSTAVVVHSVRPGDAVIGYATQELTRCLSAMTGQTVATGEAAGESVIRLGLCSDFPELEQIIVADPAWDDAYTIVSGPGGLTLAGTNPRSVLMSAYGYLRELGARWLWPGAEGEHLPLLAEIPLTGFDLRWQAPFRHRAGCIEGSLSLEHILDYLEWLPRVEMNAYMVQWGDRGFGFWNRWYEHKYNDLWTERRTISDEEGQAFDEQVLDAMKLRGLLHHRVGHGWTDAALGLKSVGGANQEDELTEETRRLIAQVGGKRELWHGRGVVTELCNSKPEARERFIRPILEYAERHPEVDALHVWLSDGSNNTCECEDCRRLTHSDWYATILNDLSPRLRQISPNMRVVFLCYLNTLWPPEQVRLAPGCDNLVFMFAPSGRCYQHRLGAPDCGQPLPPERPPVNQVTMPQGNVGNMAFLQRWRPLLPGDGDSFLFDYHCCWDWVLDHIIYDFAELLPGDLEDAAALGLGGMMCCGTQRCFYPLSLPMLRVARSLAGRPCDEEQEREYFRIAMGAEWERAWDFIQGVDERRVHPEGKQGRWEAPRLWWEWTTAEHAAATVAWLDQQKAVLEEAGQSAENDRERQAWALLQHFREFAGFAWRVADAVHRGERDSARQIAEEMVVFLLRTEPEVHRFADTGLQLSVVKRWPEVLAEEQVEPAVETPPLPPQEA